MDVIKKEVWLHQTGILLTFIMGFLWLLFGVIESFTMLTPEKIIASMLPGLFIVGLGLIAIKWRFIGGTLLVLFGVIPLILFLFSSIELPLATLLLLAFPLILSGSLLIYDNIFYSHHAEAEISNEDEA